MERRQFLKNALNATTLVGGSAVMAKAGAFPLGAASANMSVGSLAIDTLAQNQQYYKRFNEALKVKPHLKAWEGVTADISPTQVSWQGTLPSQMHNHHFYRNGPGLRVRNKTRYAHWFDGDGLVNQFALHKNGVTHKAKFVETEKYRREENAGKFLYSSSGTRIAHAELAKSPQSISQANTSLLPVNGELWALWEAAAPYRVDAETLETKGEQAFSDALKGVPFSAHPHIDRQGNIWNFGKVSLSGQYAFVIYHLSAAGQMKQFKLVNTPRDSYVHDFAMTERYLIFYLSPLIKGKRNEVYTESYSWYGQKEGRVFVVDKNTLEAVADIPTEPGFVYHFGNSWEQGNALVVNLCWYDDAYVFKTAMADLVGEQAPNVKSRASQLVINMTSKTAQLVKSPHGMEFPMFDAQFVGQKTQIQTGIIRGSNPANPRYNTVASYNTQTDNMDAYEYGENVYVEEPIFVKKQGSNKEGEGYLIHTYLDFIKDQTGVSVFDAQHVADGPLATATLPYYLPLGFHGTYV